MSHPGPARIWARLLLVPALLCGPMASAVGETDERVLVLKAELSETRRAPIVLTASEGERIRLEVVTARPIVVHIHGLGIALEATAERAGEARFLAKATGRFPVHVHDGSALTRSAQSHHHRAPFAYLEIHPR